MEIKIFGKSLFEFKGTGGDRYAVPSLAMVEKMTHLPDFRTIGNGDGGWQGSSSSDGIVQWIGTNTLTVSDTGTASTGIVAMPVETKKTSSKKEKAGITPKRVYDMQMLHDKGFKVNMDPKYVDGQIADFKAKLGLMKNPKYDHMAQSEIGSILIRMENRKKYPKVRTTFEKYPYTTNRRILSVLKNHDNLKLGEIAQFVADMPKEATEAMKEYNFATNELCGKKAVFYIIADKKDFQKKDTRRDPILLAQSPFGHFWQILGAWDEEMLFLEEL